MAFVCGTSTVASKAQISVTRIDVNLWRFIGASGGGEDGGVSLSACIIDID